MQEEIYSLAQAILGQTGEDAALRAACKAAETELCMRLRQDVSPEDCKDSFICAAAWLALAGLDAAGSGGVQGFSMADLSVTMGGGTPSKALRAQAEMLMAPWCQGAFAFRGVPS